jgi:DNA topoisomerase IA
MISGSTSFSAGTYPPNAQNPDLINHQKESNHPASSPTGSVVEQIKSASNEILRAQKSHLKLTDMVRRKDLAIQFKTATYTHVVVILSADHTIIGIVQVIDIHRPFKWMMNGLPGPNTRKIYFHKDMNKKGWKI